MSDQYIIYWSKLQEISLSCSFTILEIFLKYPCWILFIIINKEDIRWQPSCLLLSIRELLGKGYF